MGKPTKRSQGWKGTQEKRKQEQEAKNEAMIEKAVENVLKKKKIIADDNNEQNSFSETSSPSLPKPVPTLFSDNNMENLNSIVSERNL